MAGPSTCPWRSAKGVTGDPPRFEFVLGLEPQRRRDEGYYSTAGLSRQTVPGRHPSHGCRPDRSFELPERSITLPVGAPVVGDARKLDVAVAAAKRPWRSRA